MADEIETDEATRAAEQVDATQSHSADRPPTAEEEAAAEKSAETFGEDSEKVAEHYREMSEIGAEIKGEGAID